VVGVPVGVPVAVVPVGVVPIVDTPDGGSVEGAPPSVPVEFGMAPSVVPVGEFVIEGVEDELVEDFRGSDFEEGAGGTNA
jgi:hypothetical protein